MFFILEGSEKFRTFSLPTNKFVFVRESLVPGNGVTTEIMKQEVHESTFFVFSLKKNFRSLQVRNDSSHFHFFSETNQ